MEPDFEIRELSEYSESDLMVLYKAMAFAESELKSPLVIVENLTKEEFAQRLDIWSYRIRDAMAVARKRENETHPLK